MNISTAIITAAGFGSRMLPVTAAVQKELLPILNRPIIDYVVADCVAAGITRVIFVISHGSHGLQDYYLGNPSLEHHLTRYHKAEALAALHAAHSQAKFEFIEQPESDRYGTAVPIQVALPLLKNGEGVFIGDGDTFSWHANGQSEIARLVESFHATNAAGAITGLKRPAEELARYGVLDVEDRGGARFLRGLIEKPAPGQAPSDLINISKYILTPQLFGYVKNVQRNPTSGEFYFTDAMHSAAANHPIVVHEATGKLLDAGSVTGWLEANLTVARSQAIYNG